MSSPWTKRVTRTLASSTTLALVLFGTALTGSARAANVSCGQVLTTSTVLDGDVGPCASDGVIMGADNITLNLNGHRIYGVPSQGEGVGIRIEGRHGVQVHSGRATDFDAGIAILGGSNNVVRKITARNNKGSFRTDFGDGIAVSSSTDNVIQNNNVIHNGPYDGIGLFGNSRRNEIRGNVVKDNNIEFSQFVNQDDGIRLEPGTQNNVVVENKVTGSGLDGIAVFFRSPDNIIRGNVSNGNGFHDKAHRKGDGIRLFLQADDSLVRANQVFRNAANGIRVDSQSNRIFDNRTGGNASAPNPAPAYDLHDTNTDPPCDANVWLNNTFNTAFPQCTTTGGGSQADRSSVRTAQPASEPPLERLR